MIHATELNKGMTIKEGSDLMFVLYAEYHAAGKSAGIVHAKLRNIASGNTIEKRYNSTDRLEDISLERIDMEYLYDDADNFHFMNPATFDQIGVSKALVGDSARFLQANMVFMIDFHDGVPVSVIFPEFVELKVSSAPAGIKQGDITYKPVTLENGLEIMAPHFIKEGEIVRVEVATGKYAGKAKAEEEKKK
ncbi:MAG: elongation factor P [bacterium]